MMKRMGTELELMTNRIKRGVRNGRYSLSELHTNLSDKTRRVARKTDYFVHDNAWAMLGVAAGVALIGGFLLAKKTAVVTTTAGQNPEDANMPRRPVVTLGEVIHSIIPLAVLFIKVRQVARARNVKI